MQYFDRIPVAPHAVRHRPSWGLTRPDGVPGRFYAEDGAPNSKGGVKRTVLRLDPRLAPVKAAVLPLSKKAELSEPANKLPMTCGNVGTSTTTTPRSVDVTVVTMRLVPFV